MTTTLNRCAVIVLQPTGALDQASSSKFQVALQQALGQAEEMVIVDLLWVERTDESGVAALVTGMQQASELGKFLTVQSLDRQTGVALGQEWNRRCDLDRTCRSDWFKEDLEQFLDSRRQPACGPTDSA